MDGATPLTDWEPVVPLRAKGLAPFGSARRARSGSGFVLLEIPVLVVIALAVTFVLKTFVAQAFVIPSESMYPTLKIGDRVVVSRISYHLHDPHRGDVVVFPNPGVDGTDHAVLPLRIVHEVLAGAGLRKPPGQELIKRVVGLPGDTVEAREGAVFVNGRPLSEPYLQPGIVTDNLPPTIVPPGDVFVMGDNRGDSSDSRVFGPIDEDTIVGRALFRVFPPHRVAFL
jgi:signal peptidase I